MACWFVVYIRNAFVLAPYYDHKHIKALKNLEICALFSLENPKIKNNEKKYLN